MTTGHGSDICTGRLPDPASREVVLFGFVRETLVIATVHALIAITLFLLRVPPPGR